jgi:mannose-6-phosphate isomerase
MPGGEGDLIEPGHQFEWAWLLIRLAKHGLGPGLKTARGLYEFADKFGIDRNRHVAINAVGIDGAVIDDSARLWPQTERMKAAIALALLEPVGSSGRKRFEADAVDAWIGLKRYAVPGHPGHFFDKYQRDGSFVSEPSFASSLYHITCSLSELIAMAEATK